MSASKTLRGALAFAAALLLCATANAQIFRAYLASDGNDANPCTLAAPCRLLPAALAAVTDGGEIWMLDSANFNTATVTIGKSVSILAVPGAVGSVLAIGGPAVSITVASLNISLRNLVIAPLPSSGATYGISMTGASTLTIENSLIANLPSAAVWVAGSGKLKIANSIIRNSGGFAVWLQNGPQAEISGTQMLGNASGGVHASGTTATTTTASVSDSVISGGTEGVFAYTTVTGAAAKIFVTRSTIEGTTVALDCEIPAGAGSAILAVSGSTVVNNYYGWYQAGAGSFIRTLGNNHITDNSGGTYGVLTATALQ
jgi:hypothetical protein